jgi:pilus assembly protein Flp/PilA
MESEATVLWRSLGGGSVEISREEVISSMSVLNALISSFRRDEKGQGLAEYALILALIAIIAIVALIFLGGQVSSILSNVGNSI